jgi:DNA-binding transcriptional LysR family regulator
VRQALAILDLALVKGERFDPARTRRTFRLHMSDIGETVFLPQLMRALAEAAPHSRLETFQLDDREQLAAIENGRIDLALGYLPALASVEKKVLVHERYVVLARAGHPLARRPATAATLGALDYALVRSHSATARALTELGLIDRVRLTLPHFLVLPRILAETDLAVLVPSNLAQVFLQQAQFVVWRPRALPPFDVSVHWYWRYEGDPGNRWLRELIASLFAQR